MESPGDENKEAESLMDDFEKIDNENISGTEQDQRDQIGDDYDIIGEINDHHFEVLDSAGEMEGYPTNQSDNETLSNTELKTISDEGNSTCYV